MTVEALVEAFTHTRRAVIVWEWDDAPPALKALSRHGGDEDYVALLPPDTLVPLWAMGGTAFGCCDTSEHDLPYGFRVLIGAHS